MATKRQLRTVPLRMSAPEIAGETAGSSMISIAEAERVSPAQPSTSQSSMLSVPSVVVPPAKRSGAIEQPGYWLFRKETYRVGPCGASR